MKLSSLIFAALAFYLFLMPAAVFAGPTGTWAPSGNGGSAPAAGVTVTISGISGSAAVVGTMNATNFWSDPYGGTINGATDITVTALDPRSNQTVTLTFNKPVTNPVLHIDRIGGIDSSGVVNTSVWTLASSISTGGSVTFSKLAGNTQFQVSSNSFQRAASGVTGNGGECLSGDATSTACGSILLTGTGITSLTFTLSWAGAGLGTSTNGDALEIVVSVPDTKVIYKKGTTGGTGAFTFTASNGLGGTTLDTTSTNPATSPTYTISDNTAATTITESVNTGYAITATSCVDQTSASIPSSLSGNVLTIPSASIASVSGQTITCTFTNAKLPSLTLTIISNAAVGSFTFTGDNGWSSQTITTVTSGTGVTGATQFLAAAATTTTVSLSIPSGYAMANTSCTGMGSGTMTPNYATGAMVFNTAATAIANNIACTVNVYRTVFRLQITSIAGTGTFSPSAATNLASTPAAITTTVAGTAAPASPSAINVSTTGTPITTNIVVPNANWAMTAVSCTDANSSITGNTGTFGTFSVLVLTVPASNTTNGSDITCVVIETRASILFQKISAGGVATFAFASSGNLASTPSSITTTAANTVAPTSPTAINISNVGSVVSVTESAVANYNLTAFSCSDANGSVTGNNGSFGSFAALTGTVSSANVKAGSYITCVLTNSKTPTLKLQIITFGGVAGPFSFTQTNLAANPGNITTTTAGTATPASPTAISISSIGTSVTISEAVVAGYFISGASCTDANSSVTGNTGSFGNLAGATLTVPATNINAGADFTCVLSNTKGAPTLTITKTYSPSGTFSLGQLVTYTYVVTNTGNVPIQNVQISDMHGTPATLVSVGSSGIGNETLTNAGPQGPGASQDTTPNNGVWSILAPGATVTFTWPHTVTQAEIDQG